MQFCPMCESHMEKTTGSGAVHFQCKCLLDLVGTDEDTLMSEMYLEATESNLKHEVFIDNAPFDTAGNIVKKDCPDCGLDFLTLIRIGTQEQVIYVCTCGYRSNI